MAVFNTFSFDGENSLDYGVYITGEAVYNAPERAVEMVSIPGKNGALALDQGRFENIEVIYPAGTFGVEQAEFAGRMRAFRNMLASRYNYVRLTDSYHPDEYRLGLYKSGLEASPVAMSSAGEFDITFNCKPQRFLTSGEEPVDTSELGGDVTTDKEPYLFRRSGGGNIGHGFDAEIDKLIGGTVAWNQLVQNGNFANTDNWSSGTATLTVNNNIGRVTFGGSKWNNHLQQNILLKKNHKTLIMFDYLCSGGFPNGLDFATNVSPITIFFTVPNTHTRTKVARIINPTDDYIGAKRIVVVGDASKYSGEYFEISNFMIVDLTQAFGAEIADYVYSLEQTTEGSGIAWLKSHGFLTKDYYAYNEGSLLSVKTSEHRTTGFNQWDEEWEVGGLNPNTGENNNVPTDRIRTKNYIPTVSNETYYCSISAFTRFCCYDENKQYLGTATFSGTTTPSTDGSGYGYLVYPKENTHYMRAQFSPDYGTTYNNDICINISKTTGIPKNGDYEPYESHSYPLDSDLELRGIPKLSNGSLYYDGDVYESSGAVTRKYGYRAYQSGDESLTDAITDGTNTVYKLTTPTTEQADPYASPQVVNSLGTEEYVDARDVPVPVGHETKYGMSQLVLSNPTEFPSKPLLEVTGVGTFWLGDTLLTITGTAGQTIYIDCETGEAWKNVGGIITPANGLVTLNRLDFPELDPGDTPVLYGAGITKVVVTPRWWII